MQPVTVVATRAFTTDDGRAIHLGESVDLIPIEAAVRGRRGEVSLDPQARPTYNTRDMTAAPVVPAVQPERIVTPRRRRSRRAKVTA